LGLFGRWGFGILEIEGERAAVALEEEEEEELHQNITIEK